MVATLEPGPDDDESELARRVKQFPLDEEEFARQAREKSFVPSQAMYDEDWSRLLTDEPARDTPPAP